MSHYDEDELTQYVAARRTAIADPQIEAHLAECTECSARLAFVERFEEGLRDDIPWKLASEFDAAAEMPDSIRQAASLG